MPSTQVALVTGAYPTGAPSTLTGKVATPEAIDTDVNAKIVASAGSGTAYLLGWDGTDWCPIGSYITIDSTITGGVAFSRTTPGQFLSYCLWVETGVPTVTRAVITTGRLR